MKWPTTSRHQSAYHSSMKDFISENEKILDEWKISNEKYGEYNFAYDGIMNKGEVIIGEGYIERESDKNHIENQLWKTTSLRVLFLTKDQNTWGGDAWDVRAEYGRSNMESDSIQFTFYRNLMYLLYGICHTTEECKTEYDFSNRDALDFFDSYPFARINAKKEGGNSSISNNTLRFYLKRDCDFLKKQIQNLNPDVIFCCGYSETVEETGNLLLNFLNNNGYKFQCASKNNWIYFDERKNKIAINSWHLSARISSQRIFEELMNDYHSFIKEHPYFLFRIKENRSFQR